MFVLLTVFGFELGYHRDLSTTAASGFSTDARRLLVNANLYVDVKSAVALLLRRASSPLYRQHFDDCFNLGDHLVRWRETEDRLGGAPELGSGRAAVKELVRRLGSAHHSGQDFYAHSDHVEHLALSGVAVAATHDEAMSEPDLESVRNRWRTEGLKSGAYFQEPPQTSAAELHHRTLNKDKPLIRGHYLYEGRLDRTEMHRRAMACAARESDRLNKLAEARHPVAFRALATYRSGPAERLVEKIKYGFAVTAGILSGHWR